MPRDLKNLNSKALLMDTDMTDQNKNQSSKVINNRLNPLLHDKLQTLEQSRSRRPRRRMMIGELEELTMLTWDYRD